MGGASMSRVIWKSMQAASLLGLAACFVSCAGADSPSSTDGLASRYGTRGIVAWAENPPDRCAVGSSGPTLNPRNAIRYARISAIEALASGSLEVDVQTISGDGFRGSFEVSAQALSGTLQDARIVAIWAETESAGGTRRRLRQVYALSCWPDASLRDLREVDYPRWLIEPPSQAGEVCATGIAGPTWKGKNQPASALRDARLALAIAIESRIEKRVYDDGRGVAKMARQVDPSNSALARAATAEELDRDWFDEGGIGPIGLPGVLYGLACIED